MSEEQQAQSDDVSLKQRLVKHGLWFFIVLSLIVHLTGISPAIIEKLIPEEEPKPALSAEELAALAAEQARQEQIKLMQMKEQTLREQMEQSFQAIAEGVEKEVVEDVWQQVEQSIDEQFAALEEQMQTDDYDMEAFTEDYMEASASMFEETADIMKNMLRDELTAAVLKQVKEQTNPQLAKHTEKRLEEYHAEREESRLADAARRDTKRRRDEAKKEVEALKKEVNQLVKEQESLAKQEQNPKTDKKKLAQKQEQLEKRTEKLQQRKENLKKEIEATTPDVAKRQEEKLKSDALKQAQAEQTAAKDKMEQEAAAQKELTAAVQALKETAKELDQVSKYMHKGEQIDEVAKEAMKKILEENIKQQQQDRFDKALEDKIVPEATDKIVKQSKKYLDDFKLDKDAELLKRLEEEVSKALQEELPKEMKDTAAELVAKQTQDKHALSEEQKQQDQETVKESKAYMDKMMGRHQKNQNNEMKATATSVVRAANLGDMSEAMQELKSKLQMMKKAENLAQQLRDGRGELGELGEMMAMMEMMDGEGVGAGGTRPSLPFSTPGPMKGGRFNAKTYQMMLDMSKARQQPGAVYEEIQREADKLISQASAFPEQRSALIIDYRATSEEKDNAAESIEAERSVAEPAFKPIKFGYASMAKKEVVLDADLSEWDLSRKQYANILQTSPDPTYWSDEQAIPLYMMWDHTAYYIAAVVPNDSIDVCPSPKQFWVGDSIEIWMDTANKRAPLMTYREAAQMWVWPNGNVADNDVIAGMGHGRLREGKTFRRADNGIQYVSKNIKGGYQIEIAIPQSVLHGPRFEAGKYLGFQIAFNSVQGKTGAAWALRVHHSWERPDTWGDVLLLGSDGDVSFVKDDEGIEPLAILVPGEALRVKIHDPDMNIDPRFKDQIICQVIGSGGIAQMLVLGETKEDSGIFIGGIDTNSAYIGYQEGKLPVEPGQDLKVVYIDQRRDYGEARKKVETSLPVSWPTLRLSKQ